MKNDTCAQSVGRPRSFDIEDALKSALEVFWQKGYDSASLNDLTQAMGINKPSLYAAFGNKEQLFIKAIEFYDTHQNSYFYDALKEKQLLTVITKVLLGAAERMSDCSQPQGCMMIQSAFASKEPSDIIKQAAESKRDRMGGLVLARLQQAKEDGELDESCNCSALMDYLFTVIMGMSIHASRGASREQLENVANLALLTFNALCTDKKP